MAAAYFWVAILAAYQLALILAPHPEQIRRPWLRLLVQVLGPLSLFRHRAAPGTLHLPLTRQPWWSPAELERLLGQVQLEQLRQGPRQPAAPDEGSPLPRRPLPIIAWLQPAAALLLVLGLAGCTLLTQPRKATSAALKSLADRTGKLRAWSATEEQVIFDTSKTKEEGRARVDAHRKAFDYCTEEVVKPSLQDLHGVAKALDLEQPVPAGGAQ